MNKKHRKQLKELSSKLPEMVDKHKDQDVTVNHFRRLKRAYQRNGIEGLKHYLNKIENNEQTTRSSQELQKHS